MEVELRAGAIGLRRFDNRGIGRIERKVLLRKLVSSTLFLHFLGEFYLFEGTPVTIK